MKEKIKNIFQSEFFKNNIRLITGTTLAQIINFLFNIYLTRIYLPESFGKFSLYMSVLSVFLIFSSFKLDIEIVKNSDEEVHENIRRSYQANMMVSILSLLMFSLLWLLDVFNLRKFNSIWVLLSWVIIFFQTSVQILWMYCVKQKMFTFQSRYKIVEATGLNVFYLFLYGLKDMGLLLANVLNLLLTNVILFFQLRNFVRLGKLLKDVFKLWRWKELLMVFKKQKYYMFQSLLEVLQISLIPFYFSGNFEFLGYYSLSMRVLQVPMRFLSVPISQVFFSEIADRKRNKIKMTAMVQKTLLMMFILSLPIVLMISIIGPDLFGWIFGKNWMRAGEIAQILLIWIIVDFIKAPLMQILYLFEKQKMVAYILLWSILLMIIIFTLSRYFSLSEYHTLWLISLSQAIFILYIIIQSYLIIQNNEV